MWSNAAASADEPNKRSSETENQCCPKRRKQGVGIYWQEKIIERRSTNEVRMAALINVTLFALRSILNVIYLNGSICSRKLGIQPAGRLACRCVPLTNASLVSTSANTRRFWNTAARLNSDSVYLHRLINVNPPSPEFLRAAFGTLSKEVLNDWFQWCWCVIKLLHWPNQLVQMDIWLPPGVCRRVITEWNFNRGLVTSPEVHVNACEQTDGVEQVDMSNSDWNDMRSSNFGQCNHLVADLSGSVWS